MGTHRGDLAQRMSVDERQSRLASKGAVGSDQSDSNVISLEGVKATFSRQTGVGDESDTSPWRVRLTYMNVLKLSYTTNSAQNRLP